MGADTTETWVGAPLWKASQVWRFAGILRPAHDNRRYVNQRLLRHHLTSSGRGKLPSRRFTAGRTSPAVRRTRRRHLRAFIPTGLTLVVGGLLSSCGGSSGTTSVHSPEPPPSRLVEHELVTAYSTLVRETRDQPPRTFRRADHKVRRNLPAYVDSSDFLVLGRYFHRVAPELNIGTALTDGPEDVPPILAGIGHDAVPRVLTLIAPRALGHSPPSELLAAGVQFAAATRSGRVYCIDSRDPRVRPC